MHTGRTIPTEAAGRLSNFGHSKGRPDAGTQAEFKVESTLGRLRPYALAQIYAVGGTRSTLAGQVTTSVIPNVQSANRPLIRGKS
jgi:hypothetical protein